MVTTLLCTLLLLNPCVIGVVRDIQHGWLADSGRVLAVVAHHTPLSTCRRSFPVFPAVKCQQTMLGKGLELACLDCRLSTWRTRPSNSSNHISKTYPTHHTEPRMANCENDLLVCRIKDLPFDYYHRKNVAQQVNTGENSGVQQQCDP